jgi:four helix bundle protein
MTELFRFEKLDVYQKSLDIIDDLYDLSEKFPKHEIYGLTSQLRRAALSIALNVGEGSGSSDRNFNKYIGISSDSLKECVVCLTIAQRRNYITIEENEKLREKLIVIAKMMTNLKKYLNNSNK